MVMQSIICHINLCITMVRITVDVPDADLPQIDAEAKQQSISRSKWAAKAIDLCLHQMCSISDAEVMQLQKQLDAKTLEYDANSQQITYLNDELDRIKSRLKQDNNEATQRWEELKGVRNENTKLNNDLHAAQTTIQRLQAELLNKQEEVDQMDSLREELAVAKTDRDRLNEALKVRDDDVAFLRGHVSQLTQSISQLSLPPSQEEAKKKGWWQFWKG